MVDLGIASELRSVDFADFVLKPETLKCPHGYLSGGGERCGLLVDKVCENEYRSFQVGVPVEQAENVPMMREVDWLHSM